MISIKRISTRPPITRRRHFGHQISCYFAEYTHLLVDRSFTPLMVPQESDVPVVAFEPRVLSRASGRFSAVDQVGVVPVVRPERSPGDPRFRQLDDWEL